MNVWEIMIVDEIFNNESDETKYEILFGPELIITYSKTDALKMATIKSEIPEDKIPEVIFFVRHFPRENQTQIIN